MSEIDLCNNLEIFENKSSFREIILNSMSRKKDLQFFYLEI
jgi:hypothetical protein